MYPPSFDYYRPKTLAEAVKLLSQTKDARLLAGGHSLVPAMKLRLASPAALVDIGGLRELAEIKTEGGALRIGALATHASIAASDAVRSGCPVLAETAAQIGDPQVRNRGTIGGSLAHADPAADFPTTVVALGAILVAEGPSGRREIPAGGFFKNLFTTALRAGEVLVEVRVPAYGRGTGGCYLKHRHPASSYAVVGVAAIVTLGQNKCTKVSLILGGVSVSPLRLAAAEAALTGQVPEEARIAAASVKVAEAIKDPLSDLYASGEYRIHLATVMTRRALARAVERARG